MVKRCGKSAPRPWQHGWQAKPRTEQGQIGKRSRTARPKLPGRLLDPASNVGARGMIVAPERAARAARRGRTEFGLRSPAADLSRSATHFLPAFGSIARPGDGRRCRISGTHFQGEGGAWLIFW